MIKGKYRCLDIIFIGTDLPDLCHLDLINTMKELKQNDLILGPSNDGGYWLIGLSEKIISKHLHLPFINIKWSKENVLKNTIDNFASTSLKYKFLDKKIDIGKSNSAKVQSVMTKHTISVAKSLEKTKLIHISMAISGLGEKNCKRWSKELGIANFNLQGKGCLGEKMKRQIIINKKFCTQNKIKNIIFIGTDLPDLCHLDLLSTISELTK